MPRTPTSAQERTDVLHPFPEAELAVRGCRQFTGMAATLTSTSAISAALNLILAGIMTQINVFAGFYNHLLVNHFFHINAQERDCQQTYRLFH